MKKYEKLEIVIYQPSVKNIVAHTTDIYVWWKNNLNWSNSRDVEFKEYSIPK